MIIQEILQKNIINFLFYEFEIKHKIKTNPEKPLKNQSQKPFRKPFRKPFQKGGGVGEPWYYAVPYLGRAHFTNTRFFRFNRELLSLMFRSSS